MKTHHRAWAARQLPALNARAHTHLLLNTLNLVAGLLQRRPQAAGDLLALLGRYLHQSLESPRPFVPFQDEVASAFAYLGIERARLGSRLRVAVDCAADTLMVPVPSLILQPLVENAVRHGIAMKPGGGRVSITARRSGAQLLVAVADDGVGLRRGEPATGRVGWGVIGVRLRLSALCGARARVRLLSRPGAGTLAAITVPVDPTALPDHR